MEKRTLWYTRCPTLTASSIAIRNGWLEAAFRPDGIDVRSLTEAADRATHESHFSHSKPDSFRHGGNIPPIWARSEGSDVRLIGVTWSETPYAILVLEDSGIETMADLAGKRLALPRRVRDSVDFARATYLRTYELALRAAGMTPSDVEMVDLPVDEAYLQNSAGAVKRGALWNAAQLRGHQRAEIAALLRGEVDAFASSGFWIADHCAMLGARVLFDSRSVRDPVLRGNSANPSLLTASGALIDERPDLVVRWIACLLTAGRWGQEHLDETIRIAGLETGVPEAFVAEADRERLLGALDIDFTDHAVAALAANKAFLLQNGFIRRDFDLDRWMVPDLLEQARQEVPRLAQSPAS